MKDLVRKNCWNCCYCMQNENNIFECVGNPKEKDVPIYVLKEKYKTGCKYFEYSLYCYTQNIRLNNKLIVKEGKKLL